MIKKSRVFVITPFDEDYLALYDELKKSFEEKFDFSNAGDLDNQQNILQDIVEGIYQADVIIADLTGLKKRSAGNLQNWTALSVWNMSRKWAILIKRSTHIITCILSV